MFQSFDAPSRPEQGPPRLQALRAQIQAEGLSGFLVPRTDIHQGEYVAPRDERLAWLTGFTGSAGFAAVLMDQAGLFVDGRYRVQGRAQTDQGTISVVHWPEVQLAQWLREALPAGGTIGFDPRLHTLAQIEALEGALKDTALALRATDNLIDRIWSDQPAAPAGAITIYPDALAGESHDAKRARISESLRQAGQSATVLTRPDSIAWLLNIRGSDIARIPVAQGFAILHENAHLTLFTDPAKCDAAVLAHLGADVTLRPPEAFAPALRSLQGPVRLDRDSAPFWLGTELGAAGVDLAWGADPCLLPKARKSPAEIAATTQAHLRDGAAVCEFLSWLDTETPNGGLSEIDVVRKLEACRQATGALRELSFDTICGAGPNGAIVHYRVSETTNRAVIPGELLLVDSGGQYLDGTTDITRTIAIGKPGMEERAAFTRVLQGMIAISRLRFPKGLAGRDLDALARMPLWLAGQDYDHGTGHGVGVYLDVHEGPQRLSKLGHVPLEPGMILSNEPGYYREGAFGIRLENLVVVEPAPALPGGDAGREMLRFATLTLAPIDRRLILSERLSSDEHAWLDRYHADVAKKIAPLLSEPARIWLKRATAPL